MISGTFYAWDRLPVLFEFVRESLVDGWQPFELIAPGSQKLQESDEVALAECNLVSQNLGVLSFLEHFCVVRLVLFLFSFIKSNEKHKKWFLQYHEHTLKSYVYFELAPYTLA